MKTTVISAMVGLAILGSLHARTWTSADGSKTFEGDIVSYDADGKMVKVRMRSGKTMEFGEDKLSADDIEFLKDWDAENNGPDVAEELADQVVGSKLLKIKLQKVEDQKFQDYEMEAAPEYYIVYFSASW